MPYVWVDLEMDEINTDDLIDELSDRDLTDSQKQALQHLLVFGRANINEMWEYASYGNREKFEQCLRDFFWHTIGKTI